MILAIYASEHLDRPIVLASYDSNAILNEVIEAVNANEKLCLVDLPSLERAQTCEHSVFAVDFYTVEEYKLSRTLPGRLVIKADLSE